MIDHEILVLVVFNSLIIFTVIILLIAIYTFVELRSKKKTSKTSLSTSSLKQEIQEYREEKKSLEIEKKILYNDVRDLQLQLLELKVMLSKHRQDYPDFFKNRSENV